MLVKTNPVFQSLQRPRLVIGVERILLIFSATIAGSLVFGGLNRYSFVSALFWWFGSMHFWKKLAKIDPYYVRIYLRHIKQQQFYAANASKVWRKDLIGYKAR